MRKLNINLSKILNNPQFHLIKEYIITEHLIFSQSWKYFQTKIKITFSIRRGENTTEKNNQNEFK